VFEHILNMLGAWCPTLRPVGRPQQTTRHAYISILKRLGFEEEKGQLREWMTVARDSAAWALKVESVLDLPPGSFTNPPQALNEHEHERQMTNDKIGL
jgi:hypothetical protein